CSVGTVVPVATLPYSSSGRSTCGQLNDVTTANAESCGNSSYYAGEEEVFSFVPLTSGKVQVLLSSSAYNTSLFLVEGCPLATYCFGSGSTCIASAYGTAGNKILCGDVIAGRTYYVIADASSGCYPYNISISAPATGFTGSTCANPINISTLPFQSSGDNTACMANDYSNASAASCNTLYESGEDKVFKYIATGPECISITLSGASTNNIGFQVYNGCPDVVGTTCIANAGGAYSGSLSGSVNLPAAGTYYIIVDTWAAPASAEFNLYIDTYGGNQDNDLPCDAMELPLGVTVVGDVNCSGGASEPAVPVCWGTPNTLNTVWYYITAPASGSVLIRTIPGSLLNTQIAVYSGTCGAGLTYVNCNDNAAACATTTTLMSQLSLTGLTPGAIYYIVVDGVGTGTGTFGIVAINGNQSLPTIFGQECSVPLPICNDTVPVGDPGFQSFGNYCDFTGNGANCLESGERGSVWYEIPINANGFLEFTIVPNDWLGAPSTTCTDYDFGLWRIGGPGAVTCNNIFTDSVPLRCNYSWMGITGVYGASNGVAPTAYPGFGVAFMQKLPVLAGETYVLVLSNFSNSLSGFTMLFPSTAPVDYLTTPDTVYWTGSTDTDWFKSANWGGCAIPSCTISGVVLAASANQPVINAANARANSLVIEAGASLTINANRNISICGNLTNDGTFNARSNSTIVLNGTGSQTVSGNFTSNNDFVNIQVNKLSGTVSLLNDLDITGNFTFSSATSTFNGQGMGIRLAGNFDNAIGGTFTPGSGGMLQFIGSGSQSYYNNGDLEQVFMVNTGAGVNLLSDMKIGNNGSLTLSTGKIVTNAFEVNILNDASAAISVGNTSSFVQGFLRRKLPSSSSAPRILNFPVGTSLAGYQLMNLSTYNGSDPAIGSLRVHFSSWSSGAPGAVGIDPSCPITFNTTSLNNGFWTVNPLGSGVAEFHMTLYNRTYTNAANANTVMSNETGGWSIPGMVSGTCTTSPITAVLRNGISQTFAAGTSVGFGTAQGTSALPVSLLAFLAEAKTNTIECLWTTANEVNNRGFEVQRATNPDVFTTIGWVDGNGTVNVMKNYKFVDDDVQPNQVYYYRLRQVDYDGQFTITKVIAAIIRDNGAVIVEAFPNPYKEATTIRYMITRPAMVTIEIMDVTGKMVKRYQQGLQDAGQYTFPFSAKNNGLSAGTYMVSVWCDDQRYQLRLTEND
ncbi:MAG: FlgD immunoglobulin-like domain containing protein, partial [Bacteroidia bacterium]